MISRVQVFLVIRKSLKRCSALTKNQTLFNLFQVVSPFQFQLADFFLCTVPCLLHSSRMFAFIFSPRYWNLETYWNTLHQITIWNGHKLNVNMPMIVSDNEKSLKLYNNMRSTQMVL